MAVTEADCKEIVSAVKKAGVIMAIGMYAVTDLSMD